MKLMRTTTALVLVTLPLSPSAFAQWSANPAANLAIADFSGDQAVPLIAASGDGSTWMAWFDQRGGSYAVYAQRVDAQGNETFAHGGVLVSGNPQNTSLVGWDMISDGAGGCVLAFTDTRNGPDLDVYAYRLDAAGNQLWGANGVTLSADSDFEANPALARTSDGYFVCAWTHSPSTGPGAIRYQRIDGAGVLQYPANGLAITGPGTEKPGFASIVEADAGSYIISYLRNTAVFTSPRHIHAQKFNGAGAAQWNAGAATIVYDLNSVSIGYTPLLRSDGAGGAVLAWHRSVGSDFEVMVQRLSATGVEAYAHNGLSVCQDTTIELDPTLSIDPSSGDAFVFFDKRNAGQSMWSFSVQRVSTAGALLFGNNAIDLIPLDTVQKSILKSVPYAGGAVGVCFRATGPVTSELIGFRVDGAGASVWGASAVVASSVVSGKQRVALATDASGLLRMVWTDNRNDVPLGNGYDTYAQNLNADGTLGVQNTPSTSFCLGDGSGAACPCGNTGSAGRGCANATFASGALLASTGIAGASAGTDTLVLTATDIPGPGLFFQSNGLAVSPIAFGDGHLCAAVGIVRLGVVFPVAGVASYPGGLTPNPIHIGGAPIAAGNTKHYQCWYRSIPALCGAGNYDLTQGISLTWVP
ncbi:MAG: hypothetical protein JNL28_04765 [Planctomycetes bacterium]|nr:hypothetical protein [Planctomycetota bacterium]